MDTSTPSASQQPNGASHSPAPPSTTNAAESQATAAASSTAPQNQQQQQNTDSQPTDQPITVPDLPQTSTTDPGTAPRPRDARTVHMILSQLGVTAYQERVPLQLLDFAYRYTASILSDAQHLGAEGYLPGAPGSGPKGGGAGATKDGDVTLAAVRLAASTRAGYGFGAGSALPKETMLEIAAEKNRVRLPDVKAEGMRFGVRLPPERFLLTGRGWGIEGDWGEGARESPGEEKGDEKAAKMDGGAGQEDEDMMDENGEEEDEDADDGYEKLFGQDEDEEEEEQTKMDEG